MNITGSYNTGDRRTHIVDAVGAFYNNTIYAGQWGGTSSAQGNNQGVGFDASRNWTGETSSFGGSQAHNIMNPYHTCYIWRRES